VRSGGRALLLAAALGTLAVGGRARAADPCAATVGTVAGTVQSADGSPLGGARVRVQGCLGEPTTTDAAGGFVVPVPAGASVIAASAPGYYIGCPIAVRGGDCIAAQAGDAAVVIRLDPLPTDDDPAHVFHDPADCRVCHQDVYDQWNASTMAHTNGNRWVDNLYNGTDITMPRGPAPDPANPPYFGFLASHNADPAHPDRRGECANCHQPEYVGTAPTNTSFNDFQGAGMHGIACEFCHKIVDVDVSPEGIARPNLVAGERGLPAKTTMLRSSLDPRVIFGPLDDVTFPGTPLMRGAHAPVVADSRLCASCHEDHADSRDANGDFLERYDGPPSQTTYSEWAASRYAAEGIHCQDCHMPATGADRFCSVTPNTRDPSQVRSHVFEGTSPEFLKRAATLRVTTAVAGDALAVGVDVTNVGAGHSLPTGVTLRNMILVVLATDRAGTPLAARSQRVVPNWGGTADPHLGQAENLAAGRLAGLPGKGYARVLVDENLAENVLFTEAVSAFDSRIPADATDHTAYEFALPAHWQKQDVRVTARLYYRRAFKPVADQRRWNVPLGDNAHGTRGDGSDYDENLVMGEARRFLVCRGRVAAISAQVEGDSLTVAATLKLPKGETLDAARDGVRLGLADPSGTPALLDAALDHFAEDARRVVYRGDGTGPVANLDLTPRGRRAARVELTAHLAAPGVPPRLVLDLDSGNVCFRKALRCKAKGGTTRCR
jgi:Carboxypeptidase regulatory-like domain